MALEAGAFAHVARHAMRPGEVVPSPLMYRDIARFLSARLSVCVVVQVLATYTGCLLGRSGQGATGDVVNRLYEHQRAFATWLLRRMARGERLSINASVPGTGRKVATLAAMRAAGRRVLVVLCGAEPATAAAWGRDASLVGLSWEEWDGRDEAPPSATVVIVSLTRLARASSSCCSCCCCWDVVLVDDAGELGGRSLSTEGGVHTVRKQVLAALVARTRQVVALSDGTPRCVARWLGTVVPGPSPRRPPQQSCQRNSDDDSADQAVRRAVFRTTVDDLCDRARACLPEVRVEEVVELEPSPVETARALAVCRPTSGGLVSLTPWATSPSGQTRGTHVRPPSSVRGGGTRRESLLLLEQAPRLAVGEVEAKRLVVAEADRRVIAALVAFCRAGLRARAYDRVVHEIRRHERRGGGAHRLSTQPLERGRTSRRSLATTSWSQALRDAMYTSSVALTGLQSASRTLGAAMLPSREHVEWLRHMADCVPWSQQSRFNTDDFWDQGVTDAQKRKTKAWRAALEDDDFAWLASARGLDTTNSSDDDLYETPRLRPPPAARCELGRRVAAGDAHGAASLLRSLGRAHRAMVEAVTAVCRDDFTDANRLLDYLHCRDPSHPARAGRAASCGDAAKRSPAASAPRCLLCRAIEAQADFMTHLERCVPAKDDGDDPSRAWLVALGTPKARRLVEALDVHRESMRRRHNGLHYNVEWLLRSRDDAHRPYPCAEDVVAAFLDEYLARLPPQHLGSDDSDDDDDQESGPALRHLSPDCVVAHRRGHRCRCHPFDIILPPVAAAQQAERLETCAAALYGAWRERDAAARLPVTRRLGTKLDLALDHILLLLASPGNRGLVVSESLEALDLLRRRAEAARPGRRVELIACAASAKRLARADTPFSSAVYLLHSRQAHLAAASDIVDVITDLVFLEFPVRTASIERLVLRLGRLGPRAQAGRVMRIHTSILEGFEHGADWLSDWIRLSTKTPNGGNRENRDCGLAAQVRRIAESPSRSGRSSTRRVPPTPPLLDPPRLVMSRGAAAGSQDHGGASTPVRIVVSPVRASAMQHRAEAKYKVKRIENTPTSVRLVLLRSDHCARRFKVRRLVY